MKKNIPPEKAEEMLSEMGDSFLYGPGLGKTAVNLGAIFVFPPYALYVLGNAALDMSGYEPITPTMALPEEERKKVDRFYDNVTSIPGRMTAAAAGKEFRSKENAKERIEKIVKEIDTSKKNSSQAPQESEPEDLSERKRSLESGNPVKREDNLQVNF